MAFAEDIVVDEIKKHIATLTADEQALIATLADLLRGVIRVHGSNAQLAVALVGAELSATRD